MGRLHITPWTDLFTWSSLKCKQIYNRILLTRAVSYIVLIIMEYVASTEHWDGNTLMHCGIVDYVISVTRTNKHTCVLYIYEYKLTSNELHSNLLEDVGNL